MEQKQEIELKGHIIDSLTLSKVLDTIIDMGGEFKILELDVGETKTDESYCRIEVEGSPQLFNELETLGALLPKKEVKTEKAPRDCVLPPNFYGTTNYPTYVYLEGEWVKVANLEMDAVIVIKGNKAFCKRQCQVKEGEEVVVGIEGIKVDVPERPREPSDIFGFMSSETSPEKTINSYIKHLAREMKKIKDAGGSIAHVVGTAIVHTGADEALTELVKMGYVQVLFAGNGFATMDIEKQLYNTTLGMDKDTGKVLKGGYKSHLAAINEIWRAGGVKNAVEKDIIKGGVLHACIKKDIPFVIGGSLRDDGPLPDTITNVMEAQDEMRKYIRDIDMCIICASMLHGIATGNMLPSEVKTVAIDIKTPMWSQDYRTGAQPKPLGW